MIEENNSNEPLIITNDKIIARLEELQQERAKGLQILAQKQQELGDLQQTLLRIEGAIKALESLINVVNLKQVELD